MTNLLEEKNETHRWSRAPLEGFHSRAYSGSAGAWPFLSGHLLAGTLCQGTLCHHPRLGGASPGCPTYP